MMFWKLFLILFPFSSFAWRSIQIKVNTIYICGTVGVVTVATGEAKGLAVHNVLGYTWKCPEAAGHHVKTVIGSFFAF